MQIKRLIITAIATAGIALPLAALSVPAQAATTCVLGSPTVNHQRVVLGTTHNKSVTVKFNVTNCTPTSAKGLKIAWWWEGQMDGNPIANLKGAYAGGGVYNFSGTHTIDPDYQNNWNAGLQESFLAKTRNTIYQVPSQTRVVPAWRLLRTGKMDKALVFTARGYGKVINKGDKIELFPVLKRANWETGRYGSYNSWATLQFRTKTGSYKNIGGSYLMDNSGHGWVVPAREGYYRFVFKGNGTTSATTGTGKFVDVK